MGTTTRSGPEMQISRATGRAGRSLTEFRRELEQRSPEASAEAARIRPAIALANAITIGRSKQAMTQSDLAAALGTTRSAISRLESGRHAPTLSTLQALADTLGLTFVISGGTEITAGETTPVMASRAPSRAAVVSHDPQTGGWIVAHRRASARPHATQRAAVAAARELLPSGGRVEIRRRDGEVREVREVRSTPAVAARPLHRGPTATG